MLDAVFNHYQDITLNNGRDVMKKIKKNQSIKAGFIQKTLIK